MTELKFVSPILDGITVGGAISEHHGVSCYPAMNEATGEKYILKVISLPASRTQLDAFLLTGAYADETSAMTYFQEQAEDIMREVKILDKLSQLEGFLAYEKAQLVPSEEDSCVRVYLLGSYKQSLDRAMQREPMTHLGAVNLCLDLCAALTVCRRSGFLFADLKPGNIYIMSDNSYRIGDLGFLRLDSLKYTSLSDKYRSAYTAPEIADAFSSLNTTLDTYAVGMILYQIYNNGELPAVDPEQPLAPPANADYEMSEIILKACAVAPEDRWEDPAQMGQAMVSYMQRNGANDTPIVPPVVPLPEEPIEEVTVEEEGIDPTKECAEDVTIEPADDTEAPSEAVIATESTVSELSSDEQPASEENTDAFAVPDFHDEELSNLSVLLQPSNDETAPEHNETEIGYEEVSPEINEILAQADEIVAHPVPEPVVAPDPIDVPMPEPLQVEESAEVTEETVDAAEPLAEEFDSEESAAEETIENVDAAADSEPVPPVTPIDDEDATPEDPAETPEPPKKKRNWLLYVILAVLLVGIVGLGVYFYTNYYLLPVDALTLALDKDEMTVTVDTDIDYSLLTVTCDGSNGDIRTGTLDENGIVVFDKLNANTVYIVKVNVSGFHKLTGTTQASRTTPKKTNITSFETFTGSTAGTVEVVLTTTGNDVENWELVYSTSGEAEKTITLNGKEGTVEDLTVGKDYTFTLSINTDPENHYITGKTSAKHKVTAPAYAEHLMVDQCADDTMIVSWISPAETDESDWTAICIDNSGTEQKADKIETGVRTFATFSNISNSKEYTIKVVAADMRVENARTVTKEASATSLSNISFSEDLLTLTWECDEDLGKWTVSYTVNGNTLEEPIVTEEAKFQLGYLIPGVKYCITIEAEDGTIPLGGTQIFVTKEPEEYEAEHSFIKTSAKDMTFDLCTPPQREPWSYAKLKEADYTSEFNIGEKAGLLVTHKESRGYSQEVYTRLFVIYDANGNIVSANTTLEQWYKMWPNGNYCELTIPEMPKTTGEYTLHLFFNGELVTTQDFKIVD